MKVGKLTASKYLKQSDIEEPQLVTIDRIVLENVAVPGEPPKNRGIMYFVEHDKGLVLNKTNLNRAAKALSSDETDDWLGRQIVIYVDDAVEMGGEIVGGLRLRAAKTKARAAVEPEQVNAKLKAAELEDDIPF